MRLPTLIIPLLTAALSLQCSEQATNSATQGPKPSSAKPAPKIDPKPQVIGLIGGKAMFLGVDAEGSGVWRTPGVIRRVQGQFDTDLITPVQATPPEAGQPGRPAGFQVVDLYIPRAEATPYEPVAVATVYREDGSVEPPVLLSSSENRTSVLPLIGGKSVLLVKNRWGQQPISAGVYDYEPQPISSTSPDSPGSQKGPDGYKALELRRIRSADDGALLGFFPIYRADGSFEPPHAMGPLYLGNATGTGKTIENRTQVVELVGGESAFLLADPKDKLPALKGIYPDSQIRVSPDGILVTEQYLTLEGEIVSLDMLYGPEKPAQFVSARLGDQPILSRNQVIKLAGNRSAVFTVGWLRLPWRPAKQSVNIVGGWMQQ